MLPEQTLDAREEHVAHRDSTLLREREHRPRSVLELQVKRDGALATQEGKASGAAPPRALREVFVNAIIHRDYESNTPVMIQQFEDRLEILNPGGLYGDVRPEDFPSATAYRNPVLAEAARVLGFVNRFGRGVPRARAAMSKNQSLPPEFVPRERHFLVTLRKRP